MLVMTIEELKRKYKDKLVMPEEQREHPIEKEYGFMQDNETLTLEEIENLIQDLNMEGENNVNISENTRK